MSTMSLTAGTNRWASRVVIALQLAAWSAVGIVLLQKGVASLQKNPNTSNVPEKVSQLSRAQAIGHGFGNPLKTGNPTSTEAELRLSVIPLESDETEALENSDEFAEPTEQSSSKDRSKTPSKSPIDIGVTLRDIPIDLTNHERHSSSINKSNYDRKATNSLTNTSEQLIKMNELVSAKLNDKPTTITDKPIGNKAEESVNKKEKSVESDKFVSKDENKDNQENITTYGSAIQDPANKKIAEEDEGFATRAEDESRWENRRRLRIMKLNAAGGAAAAIAMVAVGAVMLVLGPAVIVLRALDERRQERRFLKLSGEEDLPPSYEQATDCYDQAPTYSSLNLDTIVDPSPPPPSPLTSPTTRHSAHL